MQESKVYTTTQSKQLPPSTHWNPAPETRNKGEKEKKPRGSVLTTGEGLTHTTTNIQSHNIHEPGGGFCNLKPFWHVVEDIYSYREKS